MRAYCFCFCFCFCVFVLVLWISFSLLFSFPRPLGKVDGILYTVDALLPGDAAVLEVGISMRGDNEVNASLASVVPVFDVEYWSGPSRSGSMFTASPPVQPVVTPKEVRMSVAMRTQGATGTTDTLRAVVETSADGSVIETPPGGGTSVVNALPAVGGEIVTVTTRATLPEGVLTNAMVVVEFTEPIFVSFTAFTIEVEPVGSLGTRSDIQSSCGPLANLRPSAYSNDAENPTKFTVPLCRLSNNDRDNTRDDVLRVVVSHPRPHRCS